MMRHYSDGDQQKAWRSLERRIIAAIPDLRVVWGCGDGYGGGVLNFAQRIFREHGFTPPPARQKQLNPCPPAIRLEALRRDSFACVVCGSADGLCVARVASAHGKKITSVDQVRAACKPHVHIVGAL